MGFSVFSISLFLKWTCCKTVRLRNLWLFFPPVTLLCQKLIRLCGEVLAAPTENEEIQFLCIVCAKLKQDPYLVNFFLEVSSSETTEKKW